jgi:type II secretory pathway predicted ATPase ExeA
MIFVEPRFDQEAFEPTVDPRFFFQSRPHDKAAQQLLSAIRAREGVVLATGLAGVGKTILCRAVLEQLDNRTQTSFVSDPDLSVDTLLEARLKDFGVVSCRDLTQERSPRATREELTAVLGRFLRSLATLDAAAVVVLDDAHEIHHEVLLALQAWSASDAGLKLLQVVLVGRPTLRARVQRETPALDGRIQTRIEVDPLAADEIGAYVARRLDAAGGSTAPAFEDRAIRVLYAKSLGVPRAINRLCALAMAAKAGRPTALVRATAVRAAARASAGDTRVGWFLAQTIIMAALLLLTLTGAAASVLVFQDPATRLLRQWIALPHPPAAPTGEVPPTLPPVPGRRR